MLRFRMSMEGCHRRIAGAGRCGRFSGAAPKAPAVERMPWLANDRAAEASEPAPVFVENEKKTAEQNQENRATLEAEQPESAQHAWRLGVQGLEHVERVLS